MTAHPSISPEEAADRLAIRELIDAYAHCADRRDAKGQMALFTADTRFIVFHGRTVAEPAQQLHGRESLAPCSSGRNAAVRGLTTGPGLPHPRSAPAASRYARRSV